MNRCLVIDDSRTMRKIARSILEEVHFDTAEAEDGEAALEYCRVEMPDLIILDFDLPGNRGLEFLRRLRLIADGKEPVIVFCATEHDVGQIAEALKAGAREFVQKPFERKELLTKVLATGLLQRPAASRPAA
ncbi:MAG: response regulator [Alphaproteobacteria bacterium]|nr:response regulator [Alphaproteobacteria bacterium]